MFKLHGHYITALSLSVKSVGLSSFNTRKGHMGFLFKKKTWFLWFTVFSPLSELVHFPEMVQRKRNGVEIESSLSLKRRDKSLNVTWAVYLIFTLANPRMLDGLLLGVHPAASRSPQERFCMHPWGCGFSWTWVWPGTRTRLRPHSGTESTTAVIRASCQAPCRWGVERNWTEAAWGASLPGSGLGTLGKSGYF